MAAIARRNRNGFPPYDDPTDEYYMSLLLKDTSNKAGILYFTTAEAYKEYCTEMNQWVSPLATRNEYIQAKRLLESFTEDLPNIEVVLNFLLENYGDRMQDLLINYELIINNTQSAKYDFAFYHMVYCFARTVELRQERIATEAKATAAAAAARIAVRVAPAATGVSSAPSSAGRGGGGGGGVGGMLTPQQSQHGHPSSGDEGSIATRAADPARSITSSSPPSAAASPRGRLHTHRISIPDNYFHVLVQDLINLYQGPEEIIFNEEITQFHIALLIKYMD